MEKKKIIRKNLVVIFRPLLFLSISLFFILACSDKPEEPSSVKKLIKISVPAYPEVYCQVDELLKEVEVLIPYHSTLNKSNVRLDFSISQDATINIDKEQEYDLSESFNIKVTAEDGSSQDYQLTATKCEGGKSAVIVSDTQKDIIPLYRQASFFTNANLVLDRAHSAGVPIYYIMLKSLKGTDRWDLPDQLHNYRDGRIVDKPDDFNAFVVKSMHRELLLKGVSRVYITGVSSMGCVIGTCRGAAAFKYETVLVSDAHSEPIGYREETAIDECNEVFVSQELGELLPAKEIEF